MPTSTPKIIDLRSDTVTKPSAGMRAAMAAAEVGDDILGRDPTAERLEQRFAEMAGKEAALFVQLQSASLCGSAGCSTSVYLHRGGDWLKVLDSVSGPIRAYSWQCVS